MSDEELLQFATDFRSGILGNGSSDLKCAMVAWPMITLLNMSGMKCEAAETENVKTSYGTCNHVWIQLEDGRVLDPTADQFVNRKGKPYPPVYLGKPISGLHR